MNNFFFESGDYALFKKALRTTKNEPVVINILSTDSSLDENKSSSKVTPAPAMRKNQSSKFEPSPFGRFFGPRKPQPTHVDMKDFSSWKNKNYRQAEKVIGEEEERPSRFSMSEFMNERFKDSKYHDLDQAKSDNQKPINEIGVGDPQYKKFSLDSYLHKLEEQTNVREKFSQNDDILEPLAVDTQDVVVDSSQDENFGFGSDVNLEKVVFDEDLKSGEKYKFEAEELDKIKARLEKMEREANNIKDKPTEKVIDGSEFSGIKDDKLDLSSLLEEDDDLVDDIEKINDTLSESQDELNISKTKEEKPKVTHKRFFEIKKNKSDDESDEQSSEDKEPNGVVLGETNIEEVLDKDANQKSETPESIEESESNDAEESSEATKDNDEKEQSDKIETEKDENSDDEKQSDEEKVDEDKNLTDEDESEDVSKIKHSEILTKADFKDMTDELINKFTEMSKKNEDREDTDQVSYVDVNTGYDDDPYYVPYDNGDIYQTTQTTYPMDTGIQSQLQQIIDANQKSETDMQEKLRLAQLEKENLSREYESKIRAMEQDFKQSYEDIKNKIYLDKLDRDVKLQEVEKKFKKKTEQIEEKEKEVARKRLVGEMFKKELKSNIDISNLEMDKKLLEVASELHKVNEPEVDEETEVSVVEEYKEPAIEEEIDETVEDVEPEKEEIEEEPVKKPAPKKKSTSSKTKKRRTGVSTKKRAPRSPNRRKIDSDIIGGIDFD